MTIFFLAALVLLIIAAFLALTGDGHLRTEAASPADVQGKFTLLLYGCRTRNDIENVAILDREGDPYSFEIAAPDFSCVVRSGFTADEALREAEQFVRCNMNASGSQLRRILGPSGAAVGFDVTPLYPVILFGREDVLDVQYSLRDRAIVARIRADQAVERAGTG